MCPCWSKRRLKGFLRTLKREGTCCVPILTLSRLFRSFLQQLVAKECLRLEHSPGKINPADALTKSPTPENLVSLYKACGLVEEPMVLEYVKPFEGDRKKVI